jgi:hypothetical protein
MLRRYRKPNPLVIVAKKNEKNFNNKKAAEALTR